MGILAWHTLVDWLIPPGGIGKGGKIAGRICAYEAGLGFENKCNAFIWTIEP